MSNRRTVLLVEDNELNIEILSSILEKEYHVLKAYNGKEAIDILNNKSNKISLVMTDVNMPLMGGYELLDYLKKDEELSLIPVIVMTQSDSQEEELAALSHGANDFLPKPYRPSIILHRARNLIKFRETAAIVNELQKDRLTGLYTREYFYKKAEEKVSTEPTAKPTNAATEQLMNLLNSSPDLAAQLLQMLTANQAGQAATA